jgi:hypothetical protein
MKYIAALGTAVLMLLPLSASANALEPSLSQLLARMAAFEAHLTQVAVTCAMATDRQTVKTGETFTLAWATYGAAEPGTTGRSELSPQDEVQMRAGVPGYWKYSLTFNGANGGDVTCVTYITVTE